jgi:hypothetical protein
MVGYIVVEPDLRIECVPDHLLEWDDIRWPAASNMMPEKQPCEPTPMFKADELYHRYRLTGDDIDVFVWSKRDATALPNAVATEIRRLARPDRKLLDSQT